MIKTYIKLAFRNLLKTPTQSIINITGLSIGMTASVLIMLWVNNELNFDNYHQDPDQIYRITQLDDSPDRSNSEQSPYIMAEKARQEIPGVEDVAILMPSYGLISLKINKTLHKGHRTAYVNDAWFKMFKYNFIKGNASDFVRNPHSLLLTETAALKYFGRTDAIGNTLSIDSTVYQVRAVVSDNPASSSFQFDLLIPISAIRYNQDRSHDFTTWGSNSCLTFVRIRKDADPHKVGSDLNALFQRNVTWKSSGKYSVIPLRDMHFEKLEFSQIGHGDPAQVKIFSLMAVILLLVACINYVNLVTAKASLRAKEVGVRKISGASRLELFKQFLIETVVTSFISLLLTVVLVAVCMPPFNAFVERTLDFVSLPGFAILIGTVIAVIILSSIYPALLLSALQPIHLFRGSNLFSIKDAILRKGLVITQFAVSIVLIVGIVVIYKQQEHIRAKNVAHNSSRIFSLQIPFSTLYKMQDDPGSLESSGRRNWLASLKTELLSSTRIADVTFTSGDLNDHHSVFQEGPRWIGKQEEDKTQVSLLRIDPDFNKLFKAEVVAGRWISNGLSDKNNFIINETAAKELNIPEPLIGQEISLNNITGKIVGVVKDFHYRNLREKIGPLLMAYTPDSYNYLYVSTTPGNIGESIKAAEKVYENFLPNEPFEYTFMDESFNKVYKAEHKIWVLLNLFTGIILFVSCMGIFGLSAHTITQRTKEIGIRKVLGATLTGIAVLISKDFMKLVGISVLIASPIAWYLMTNWLDDFAYRIEIQLWMFTLAGSAAVIIALITVSFQSIKAAIANPVKSLRSE